MLRFHYILVINSLITNLNVKSQSLDKKYFFEGMFIGELKQ